MNNWECPHIAGILEDIESTNNAISEELKVERQRIVSVLDDHVKQIIDEIPQRNERNKPKAPKNSSLNNLPRTKRSKPSTDIDNTLMHEVKLFNGVSILLCDDCYRTIQRGIVIEILDNFKGLK